MSDSEPTKDQIRTLSEPGGRGRAACAKAASAGPELAAALKRALPFLARKRLAIVPDQTRCVSFAELAADTSILYTQAWKDKGTNARGLVFFDEAGLARVLDGVLGGGTSTKLPSAKLTSAQLALASRVTTSIVRAFADALESKLGLAIEPIASKEIDAGVAVTLSLAIEGEGRISVALPLACIRADEPSEPPKVDDGIAAAMMDVDIDIVAELGKVRLSLDAIAKLRVGDVVRLSLPLDERARVSAGGAVLFHGRPTASGEVVAVALERMAS
jgi:flagellar motor switch protein FliM